MCDFSLEMYASRPARESEKYVTTRFPSGSIGVAAPGDCSTAVCILYDTKLNLEGISRELQTGLGVRSAEQVMFARLQHGAYRDGVRFGNGRELSLQLLGPGVRLSLVGAEVAPKPTAHAAIRQRILEPAE